MEGKQICITILTNTNCGWRKKIDFLGDMSPKLPPSGHFSQEKRGLFKQYFFLEPVLRLGMTIQKICCNKKGFSGRDAEHFLHFV